MPRKIIMKPKSKPLEITVGYVYSQISGLTDSTLIDRLDKRLSYYIQGYQFSKAYTSGWFNSKTKQWEKWDGKKHLLTPGHKFLTGLRHSSPKPTCKAQF